MTSARILRFAVIAELPLIAISVACSFALEESLPAELQVWATNAPEEASWMLIAFYVALLGPMFTGFVGLIMLKRWARWPYLISTLIAHAPIFGPSVQHEIAASFHELATLISGVVIALCFFTDALQKIQMTDPSPSTQDSP